MAKYKAILYSSEMNKEVLGTFDTKEEAINACVNWGYEEGEIENNEEKDEVRNALEQREYCCLGYSSYQVCIEKINN